MVGGAVVDKGWAPPYPPSAATTSINHCQSIKTGGTSSSSANTK